jgi:hypothetical protein
MFKSLLPNCLAAVGPIRRTAVRPLLAAILQGCAVPGTQVLTPYRLADGTRFQDVVTIGADKTGTAPGLRM